MLWHWTYLLCFPTDVQKKWVPIDLPLNKILSIEFVAKDIRIYQFNLVVGDLVCDKNLGHGLQFPMVIGTIRKW